MKERKDADKRLPMTFVSMKKSITNTFNKTNKLLMTFILQPAVHVKTRHALSFQQNPVVLIRPDYRSP
jgi:hypothetical protein